MSNKEENKKKNIETTVEKKEWPAHRRIPKSHFKPGWYKRK